MPVRLKAYSCVLLTLALGGVTGVARASPEGKRACVAASTAGQTERDEGDLLEARKMLLVCASDECPRVVRKSCGQWLADVEQRIPSVVVRVRDAQGADVTDAQLRIDGEPGQLDGRSVPLNPGPHTLLVIDASGQTSELRLLLAEKETSRLISVQLAGAEERDHGNSGAEPVQGAADNVRTEPAKLRRAGRFKLPVGAWALSGTGLVGLAGFTYFAISAHRELGDLKRECSPKCTSDQTADGKRSALIADVSLGVGTLALIGAGTWTLVARYKNKGSDRRQVSLVPTRDGWFAAYGTRF